MLPCSLVKEDLKKQTESAIRCKINQDDPDSSVQLTPVAFPINDLLNSDSFIEKYPDVLDLIVYMPSGVEVLKQFSTCSGFILTINSLKEVKLGNWLSSSFLGKNKSESEFDQMLQFLRGYVETQVFNILLRSMDAGAPASGEEQKLSFDPQEYFDEVARCCADVVVKNVVPERVKPQLFQSSVEYSIYPVSESITRQDMLKHRGMNVTFSGNVGIEKAAGGVLKKGKINLLVDMSIKVIVFNNYLFSKRGLNLILNGIRERERINRSSILDEDLERARNNATLEMPTTKNYTTYDNSFTRKLKTMVNENVQPHLDKKIEKKREEIVDSMISKGGISETAVKLVIE